MPLPLLLLLPPSHLPYCLKKLPNPRQTRGKQLTRVPLPSPGTDAPLLLCPLASTCFHIVMLKQMRIIFCSHLVPPSLFQFGYVVISMRQEDVMHRRDGGVLASSCPLDLLAMCFDCSTSTSNLNMIAVIPCCSFLQECGIQEQGIPCQFCLQTVARSRFFNQVAGLPLTFPLKHWF